MSFTDSALFDPTSAIASPESQPVPGIAHGSIPGLLGVKLNEALNTVFPGRQTVRDWLKGGPPPANLPPPSEPAPLDTSLARNGPPTSMPAGPPAPMPPAQGFGDTGVPVQGFGDERPLAPPLPPATDIARPPEAAMASAPPLGAPGPLAGPAQQPAAASPAAPPAALAQDNSLVPKDSLIGRLMSGLNNWRDQNRLTLLAMAGGLAGAPSIGTGLGRAFTAAVPAQQADIRLAQQNQTAMALQSKGMSPQMAQVAAQNPAILQQLLPQLFGVKQKKFTQIGEDAFGNKKYGFVDEVSGQVTPFEGSTPFGGGGSTAGADLHGEDYLKTIDPQRADTVRSIAQGRQPFPSGFMLKTPYGQWLQSAIGQYEPGFNAQTYQQRQKAFNDWYGGGKSDQTMKRLDQAIEHASSLASGVNQLGNWQVPAANALANTASAALGNPAAGPLATNAHALADELAGIWKGSNLSDSEIKAWGQAFPVNGSIPQQKAAVDKLVELVEGGMRALEDQRQRDLGPAASQLPDPVQQRTRGILEGLKGWAKGSQPTAVAAAGPAAPAPPKVGEIRDGYRYKGGNPADPHSWEPVK